MNYLNFFLAFALTVSNVIAPSPPPTSPTEIPTLQEESTATEDDFLWTEADLEAELEEFTPETSQWTSNIMTVNQFSLPVLMYHSVVEDNSIPKYSGNPFVLDVEELRADLMWIESHGYETVVMADLFAYVYEEGDLPEKPIMLTFDDGYEDNYHYLFPLLQEFEMKAVICLIGMKFYEEPKPGMFWHLTAEQAVEMEESGLVEFQCHTYDMHFSNGREGSFRLKGESLSTYQQLLQEDLEKNQATFAEIGLKAPTTFSYPGGCINKENSFIVEQNYSASLVTWPLNDNMIRRGDGDCLLNLTRYNRNPDLSSDVFFQRLLDLDHAVHN